MHGKTPLNHRVKSMLGERYQACWGRVPSMYLEVLHVGDLVAVPQLADLLLDRVDAERQLVQPSPEPCDVEVLEVGPGLVDALQRAQNRIADTNISMRSHEPPTPRRAWQTVACGAASDQQYASNGKNQAQVKNTFGGYSPVKCGQWHLAGAASVRPWKSNICRTLSIWT